mmetsp:Transcript_11672/g.31364  ORF Transcript_11672/g.31364 Transcript_11672/m.31364 type:complete len:203 (+) Transcript_11672:113-721(+)
MTSVRRAWSAGSPSRPRVKFANFLPVAACTFNAMSRARNKKSAMVWKSFSPAPRVVIAQLPRRTPPGVAGDVSPGNALRLRTNDTRSHKRSIFDPVRLSERKSHNARWLSVPSVAMRQPFSARRAAKAWQLETTSSQYRLNSGVDTSPSCTAMAPMVALCGPPCSAGNTASSTRLWNSLRQNIMPPRGPRRLLCVVVVTTSA